MCKGFPHSRWREARRRAQLALVRPMISIKGAKSEHWIIKYTIRRSVQPRVQVPDPIAGSVFFAVSGDVVRKFKMTHGFNLRISVRSHTQKRICHVHLALWLGCNSETPKKFCNRYLQPKKCASKKSLKKKLDIQKKFPKQVATKNYFQRLQPKIFFKVATKNYFQRLQPKFFFQGLQPTIFSRLQPKKKFQWLQPKFFFKSCNPKNFFVKKSLQPSLQPKNFFEKKIRKKIATNKNLQQEKF